MKKILVLIWSVTAFVLLSTGAGSAITCPGSYSKTTWTNCQGTFTYANGGKYVGEWVDGEANGQGTLTYANGDKYVGEWVDSKKTGQGTFTWANGDKYVGEYKNDQMNGQGTHTFGPKSEWAGAKYVGEWVDSKKTGQGTFTYANGGKYVGEWVDGEANGQGTFTYANGGKYVGEWVDSKKTGQGTFTYANGTVKEGMWENDVFKFAKKISPKPEEKTCDDDPTLCTIAKLCSNATIWKNGKRAWTTHSSKKSHVEEAKKNGLRCGVEIEPEQPKPKETYKVASGTGFYISKLGHLITNHHVIEGCKNVKAHRKGVAQEATIIAVDKLNDLALLKVKTASSYVFPISKENPYPLQEIIVAGFPFGDAVSSSIKFTQGIVSAMSGIGDNYSQIQIDAAIQPGNSGGPIVDEFGNVIAVAVSKLDLKKVLKDYGVVPENTNFGIKASAVINLLDGNNVSPVRTNTKPISKGDLSRNVTEGTTHLSCWMTMAQIEQLKTKKILFKEFE